MQYDVHISPVEHHELAMGGCPHSGGTRGTKQETKLYGRVGANRTH